MVVYITEQIDNHRAINRVRLQRMAGVLYVGFCLDCTWGLLGLGVTTRENAAVSEEFNGAVNAEKLTDVRAQKIHQAFIRALYAHRCIKILPPSSHLSSCIQLFVFLYPT